VVTLTATVMAGATAVTPGQVNFCDASAILCTDIHLLGTAALNSSGVATFKFVPGPGTHSYKTAFVGNIYGLSSSSAVQTLTVGPAITTYWDTTAITESGSPGNYSLTATVTGFGGSEPLSGNVSFLDTSFGNTVLATALLGPITAEPGWLISQLPVANSYMIAEVTGDFNGDGKPDLALLWGTGSNGPYSITIFFGNGDGTFTTGPTTSLTGINPDGSPSMIVGDFNGDGKLDLAFFNFSYSSKYGNTVETVTTYLGNGDGTFNISASNLVFSQGFEVGVGEFGSIVTADFNGDGKLDIAIVGKNNSFGGVAILLGNGDGTFQPASSTLLANQYFALIASGDFNGDGIQDLVATKYGEEIPTATIFLGNGDGTFTAQTTPLTVDSKSGGNVNSFVVGDFNGDGVLDLAFLNSYGVHIFLGKGDGTFNQASDSPISVPNALYSLTAGDFSHDGKLDMVGINSLDDLIVLLEGAGDGTFTVTPTTPAVSQAASYSFALVAADFNGDGVPDLALLTPYVDTATILLTEPSQTATATVNGIAPVGAATHNVEASYAGNNYFTPEISSSTVALYPGVAMPVITPATGAYNTVQTVTITDTFPGATIYYEAFGIVNTNGLFVAYTGPITISQSGGCIIYAYATATGYQQSQQASANITMNLPPSVEPVISLASGSYSGAQTVTITDSMAGTTIYYTTNGNTPTTSSAQYSGPITVSATETLVASALASGYSMSPATFAQYFIAGSSNSFIYTFAGDGTNGYSGDGGPATVADLNTPLGTVSDSAGNFYIADAYNNVIRKVAAGTGVITTVAGTGIAGYSGDNGPATSAQLNYPEGVALDSNGNLYIADSGNAVIRMVSVSTGVITTFAGSGVGNCSGDNGPAISAGLGTPTGIAFDNAGNLYIDDPYCSRIRKIAIGTGTITTYAGNGQSGYSGDNGPATSAELEQPQGIALDSAGNLYIADTYNDIVREVNAQTGIITTVAGTQPTNSCCGFTYPQNGYSGDGGLATNAKLYWPEGLAVDGAGNLYIADYQNSAIRKVTAGSGIITTVAGNGSVCSSSGGDGSPATDFSLCFPQIVSVDNTGNLYIPYGSEIKEVTVPAATPTTAPVAPVFSVSSGTYVNPQTVTLTDATPGAAIYVTLDGTAPTNLSGDYHGPINVTGTVTIQAIAVAPGYLPSAPVSAAYTITTPPTAVISTVAGNGTYGYPDTGAGGPATSAEIGHSQALTLDSNGNIYFSDYDNNVVWMVSAATGTISIVAGNGTQGYSGDNGPATSAQLESIYGLAVDSAGNLYITDESDDVVRKVTASTGVISTIAGIKGRNTCISSYPTCQIGDGGPATSAVLAYPQGLAVDSAGNLYIADSSNYVVRIISASTGIISTYAGNGQASYSGDGGPATSAGLRDVEALAVDSAGNLYISSQYTGRIRKVTASTGIITTVAGNGNPDGSSGDGGLATSAEIAPEGIAVDSAGNLYLSNQSATVREVSASTGMISTVAGSGYFGYNGDGGSATVAEIRSPQGIALDATGNLYFADASNYRVRKVTFPGPAATPLISLASGNYFGSQSVTISDSITGASIYYTTDGTVPSTASNLYSGAITVSASETLQAIAVATGYVESAAASSAYTISPIVAQTITFTDSLPATATYSANLTYPISAAGGASGNPVTFTVSGPATLSSGILTITGASSVTITANQAASAGYATATPVTQSILISAAAQSITFTDSLPATATYSANLTYPISATGGDSGNPVTFTVSGPATLSSGTLTITGAGTVTITANQAASAGYAAATPATQSIQINSGSNPVPVISGFLPAYTNAGGPAFTLTVNGSAFMANSTVNWGSTALATTYVSSSQLTAQVTASQIATAGIYAITVQTPAPGGGVSSALQFEVDMAGGASTAPTITTVTATVTAGFTASYTVTFPSNVTGVTVACLNLPAGATCTYSDGLLTIATSATTPAGVYQITVIFVETVTETVPGTAGAGILLPILLLPLLIFRRRLAARGIWVTACVGLVLMAATAAVCTGCGGGSGGGSNSTTTTTQTHQVTSSIIVSLTVK
jgi:sugar lactone lactonase YvrE